MKNIKKYILSFILFLAFCIFGNSKVFGYMIPIMVELNPDGTTGTYTTIVAAHKSLINDTENWNNTKPDWKYIDYDYKTTTQMQEVKNPSIKSGQNNDYSYNTLPFLGTYTTDFFRFSTAPTSTYLDVNNGNATPVLFYKYTLTDDKQDIKQGNKTTKYVEKVNNDNKENGYSYFYSARMKRINLQFTSSGEKERVKETYELDNSLITELETKLGEGYDEIYVSASAIRNFGDNGYLINIDTLAKWFLHLDMTASNGFSYSNLKGDDALNGTRASGSIANEYDNILVLPENMKSPVKVMVRHINSKTKEVLLGNPDETLIDKDNNQSIIKTGWSTLKNQNVKSKGGNGKYNVDGIDFSEYYEIKRSQGIRVDRLRDYMKDGKKYTVTDCKVVTRNSNLDSTNINTTMKNASKPGKTNSYTYSPTKDIEYVYIDFYYNIDDVPPSPPTPDPGFDTKIQNLDGKNDPANCLTVTVPAGESVKPFLETPSYQLKNLRYDLTISNDNNEIIDYKIGNCSVLKLTSGKLTNSSDSDIGQVIGPARSTVFDGDPNSSLDIPLTTESKNKINDEISNNFSAIKTPIDNLPDQNKIKTVGNKTSRGDFNKYYNVPSNKYNGLRKPDIYAEYSEYNVIDSTVGKKEEKKSNNKLYINVFTPLNISAKAELTSTIVDHTTDDINDFIIQKNAEFTVTPKTEYTTYNNITGTIDTSNYLKNYMIILDFDAQITQKTLDNINSSYKSNYYVGQVIESGTAIEIGLNDKFVAIATSDKNEGIEKGDKVSQTTNNVKVVGITKNMPSPILLEKVKAEVVTKKTTTNYTYVDNKIISSVDYNCGDDENSVKTHTKEDYNNEADMYYDAKYFAITTLTSRNIGRIYDFKVTDCSDIDYKKVFRISDKATSGVNNLTGIQYFSGIKKFNIYTNEVNSLDDRNNINIKGTGSKTILPLGPYKSTEISYVNAPKLGYRISFDLKTSGYYDYANNSVEGAKRTVNIKPSYYYISKKGDNNGNEKIIRDIDLYYKNSSGRYVNLNGSNYTIYFKPNDGYRMEYNKADTPNLNAMSTQLEPINISNNSGFDLTYKMMGISDNNFIQSWYGEFKLPNSTIAVKKGSSINNPLTDGYIGVKFEITCTDELNGKTTIISYNTNDKKANPSDNTTQWDYEGFLGFTNFGHQLENGSIILQLEKGNLSLDNDMYNFIKGTVVLFDIDNRAANDFD